MYGSAIRIYWSERIEIYASLEIQSRAGAKAVVPTCVCPRTDSAEAMGAQAAWRATKVVVYLADRARKKITYFLSVSPKELKWLGVL